MKYPVSISIIMPAYNAEEFIGKAVESIISQSFIAWELIVVDDASTDNTVQIIEQFKDPRITLFRLDHNVGNYAARNHGLSHAKGKYVACFDADDISLPNRLQLQYEYLEKNKLVGAIGSNFKTIDSEGVVLSRSRMECTYPELKVKLLADNYLQQSTLFVRNYLLKKYKIRYSEDFKYASDYHFVFQCCTHFRTLNIPEYLVLYRVNPGNITTTKFKEQQQYASQIRRLILKCYFEEILSVTDYDILDKLMSRYKSDDDPLTLDQIEESVNKILLLNQTKRDFQQAALYKFLYYHSIKYSIDKNLIQAANILS